MHTPTSSRTTPTAVCVNVSSAHLKVPPIPAWLMLVAAAPAPLLAMASATIELTCSLWQWTWWWPMWISHCSSLMAMCCTLADKLVFFQVLVVYAEIEIVLLSVHMLLIWYTRPLVGNGRPAAVKKKKTASICNFTTNFEPTEFRNVG